MAWYNEAIFYHIYPLGMLGAEAENHYGKPVHRLRELKEWIVHIRSIGCNAIYIGPLFESVGHGYETTDYSRPDSRLGDKEDLKWFMDECHKSGIRVIFDGVFNHTGRDFFAFKDIRVNREKSPYLGWYCNVNLYGNNEYGDGFSYDNWGGYNLLAKLNLKNPEVCDYLLDVVRNWVYEYDVDGIRLDAADVLDFDFMRALRHLADEIKPDFWLMGEVIHGDYSRWVNDNTLHSVTNYALHKALFSGHNDHNYFEIAHTVRRMNDMHVPSQLLYNFTDNHDVARIISQLNNTKNYEPVHVLEYTLPGIPSIYYGSEFAIEGRKEKYSDTSLRPQLKYDDFKNSITDNPATRLIAALGAIRHKSHALSYGDYREVMLTNRQYAYTRNTDNETVIVVVNNDEGETTVSFGGIRDGEYEGALHGGSILVSSSCATVTLKGNSGEIFLMKNAAYIPDTLIPDTPCAIPLSEHEISSDTVTEKQTEVIDKEGGKAEKEENPDSETERKNAGAKYGLDVKYDEINPDEIRSRSDYENMSVEELQVAILEKMSANGYVDSQMIRTVMENVYPNSLLNWVRSFNR